MLKTIKILIELRKNKNNLKQVDIQEFKLKQNK